MDFVLAVGKYFFLALLYLFVFLVYRAILRDVRGAGTPAPSGNRRAHGGAPSSSARQSRGPAPASGPILPAAAPPQHEQGEASEAAARLVVVESPDVDRLPAGTVLPLSAATSVGRSSENAIELPDRFASAHHVLIYLARGKHVLRDRDSTNGTFVNGTRIYSEVVLSAGDRLEIGTTILEYRQ